MAKFHLFVYHGHYSMLYFVVNRFQVAKLRTLVHGIDEHTYVTITEIADVYKGKKRKTIERNAHN
jgi:uncharacterized membrane-anchored protein YitT (DUF2179 family)